MGCVAYSTGRRTSRTHQSSVRVEGGRKEMTVTRAGSFNSRCAPAREAARLPLDWSSGAALAFIMNCDIE
jgi:hypothetical protein